MSNFVPDSSELFANDDISSASEEIIEETASKPDDNDIATKLDALAQAIHYLQECFDTKIRVDTHQNELFDKLHNELTNYQNGKIEKSSDVFALDVIQLTDNTKGYYRVFEQKEPSEDNYKALLKILKGISQELSDILYRQNIEEYQVPGHEVDPRRQKVIKLEETDDESKNNLIASRAAPGYEKDGRILRPERVRIFKYVPKS